MLLLKCYLPKYPMPPADLVVDRLLGVFGGVTTMPFGVGTWYDPNLGEYNQEPVRVVECYIPNDDHSIKKVYDIMAQYKEDAKQAEVLYSLNQTEVIKL